jgi:TonB-linked SusC/RagA family outer membrane protein
LGYFDQEGVIIHTGYKKFTTTINSSFNIKNRLRIGENLIISYNKSTRDNPLITGLNMESRSMALLGAFRIPEITPIYDIGEEYAGTKAPGTGMALNPVAYAERNKNNTEENIRLMGSVFLEVDILNGLTFKTNFSPNYKLTFEHKEFTYLALEGFFGGYNNLQQYNNNSFNWTWYNTLTYNHTFTMQHNLQALIGTEAINYKITEFYAARSNYAIEELFYQHLDAGESNYLNSGISEEWSLFSVFAKIDYNFRDKYILSGTIRRDGSSRFGRGNKYGIFPAFSAAWRISDESFMQSIGFLDDFKIRAGWGQTGNQNIGNYRIYSTYGLDIYTANYDIIGTDNTVLPGFQSIVFGNPETRWETTTTTNVGFDLSMFNNALNLNFDWYSRLTTDMLIQAPLIGTKGLANPPFINVGEMKNEGIEVAMMYNSDENRDFIWSAGLNFTHYKNEAIHLYDSTYELIAGPNLTREGHPISLFFGYHILGIFQDEQEVEAHADQGFSESTKGVGRWKYADIDSNNVINALDRTFIGSPHPDFTFGIPMNFRYKNLFLNLFWYGSFGNDIYNNNKSVTDFIPHGGSGQTGKTVLQSWGMPGVNKLTTKLPQIVEGSPEIESSYSSYFIEDGSFIRLNQVTLGYDFKTNTWAAVEQLRLYLQADNLFTITNYQGMDPLIPDRSSLNKGVDVSHYPNVRSFMLGLNVTF